MITAYHGSCQRFERFVLAPPRRATSAPTAHWGCYCVADPRVAAHFTLRPHVLEEGYQSPEGSRCLLDDPWLLDPDPYLPGAGVARVAVHFNRPLHMAALDWAKLVEKSKQAPHQTEHQWENWKKAGYDGLIIAPAPQGVLGIEATSTTWLAFYPEALRVLSWQDVLTLA